MGRVEAAAYTWYVPGYKMNVTRFSIRLFTCALEVQQVVTLVYSAVEFRLRFQNFFSCTQCLSFLLVIVVVWGLGPSTYILGLIETSNREQGTSPTMA